MDLTSLVILACVIVVSYMVGYNAGIQSCIILLQEFLKGSTDNPKSVDERLCRAEMQDDVVYLYDITDGGDQFLAQGKSAKEILNNLDRRFGVNGHHFLVIDGEESVKNILRQWAKEGQNE